MIDIIFRPNFVLRNETLIRERIASSCGLILGRDGLPFVAILGGFDNGMEIWNPRTSEINLLWDEIPPEVGGNEFGLLDAEMLSINSGSELILYGGNPGTSVSNGIWKFKLSDNSWER